jgi:hypothetical protein
VDESSSLADRATSWLERCFDPELGLVRYPSRQGSPTHPYEQPGVHVVRETATLAVALLRRAAPGDAACAESALRAVLAHQIDAPGSPAHGTFRRSPREPVPGPAPREWIDYDPNWREFVGSAFALALAHDRRLSADCVARLEAALRRAVRGSLDRGVAAEYTNVALMSAFLLDFAGERLGESAWRRAGEELAGAVAAGYRRSGAFPEHNSPTYYGTDLYGLALWRARAPSERLRALGAELEAALWRDLARFYHGGLRNLCGPYTRAYGMDMGRYVAGLGCWIAPVVEPAAAPLPPLGDDVEHGHDFAELVFVGELGTRPPEDVLPHLRAFRGERRVEQRISESPPRVATAWLGERAMWGGEASGGRTIHWQHHPATLHWRRPDGELGWMKLATTAPADAAADTEGLTVTVHTGLRWLRAAEVPVWLELSHEPDAPLEIRDGAVWALPGLTLRLAVSPSPPFRREGRRIGLVFAPGGAPRALDLRLGAEETDGGRT